MSAIHPMLRRIAKAAPITSRAGVLLLWAMMGSAWSQTALDPEAAGPDFLIQGEYSGKVETVTPMGVQVVALGSGSFQAVFLPGGLPGQGWNGKDRIEAPGATATAGKAEFSGSGYTATITADGSTLSGKTAKGELFTFNKIVRKSPTEGALPSAEAIVLFDGNGVAAWKDGTASMDSRKLFKPEGVSAAAGAVTKQTFQSFSLHLEFRLPFMPAARGQRRGNSGIYLQGRDELQVLDSFGNALDNGADTMAAKRECGAFFEYFRPSANMAYPPLSWQTFDIDYTASKYDAAGKIMLEPARARVRWNGEVVHANTALTYSTLLGDLQSPAAGPQRFQAYGDPVYYRNIWITDGATSIRKKSRGRQGMGRIEVRNSATGRDKGWTEGRTKTTRYADGRTALYNSGLAGKISYSRGDSNDF